MNRKYMLRGVCAMALMLGGCSDGENGAPEVPAAIQEMMAADFPADGEIHVQSRGTFEIRPETKVCRAQRDVVSDFKDAAPSLLGPGLGEAGAAASSGLSGRLGEAMSDGTVCSPDRINVINTWGLSLNRDGTPYRLVAAVWQGDPADGGAIWVGGLERRGDLPDLPPPVDDMPSGEITVSQQEIEDAEFVATVKWNLAKDANALTKKFSETIAVAGQ